MPPELETLLLVIAIADVVGVVSALTLRPRRLALVGVATVLLIPVVGTAIQLVALQFRVAESEDRNVTRSGSEITARWKPPTA